MTPPEKLAFPPYLTHILQSGIKGGIPLGMFATIAVPVSLSKTKCRNPIVTVTHPTEPQE